jgi:hypothetical protein
LEGFTNKAQEEALRGGRGDILAAPRVFVLGTQEFMSSLSFCEPDTMKLSPHDENGRVRSLMALIVLRKISEPS